MLKEFKQFAMKGNVVDLAIGVIIGAILGGLDFSNYFIGLNSAVNAVSLVEAKKQGAVLAYGSFITVAVNFLIIAFVLFLVVKGINQLRKSEADKPAEPEAPAEDVKLLTEIRDLLSRRPA